MSLRCQSEVLGPEGRATEGAVSHLYVTQKCHRSKFGCPYVLSTLVVYSRGFKSS